MHTKEIELLPAPPLHILESKTVTEAITENEPPIIQREELLRWM